MVSVRGSATYYDWYWVSAGHSEAALCATETSALDGNPGTPRGATTEAVVVFIEYDKDREKGIDPMMSNFITLTPEQAKEFAQQLLDTAEAALLRKAMEN